MKYLIVFICIFTFSCSNKESEVDRVLPDDKPSKILNTKAENLPKKIFKTFKKQFPGINQVIRHNIQDRISETPINTSIYQLRFGTDKIIYAREIRTTTGCNSECLPINYTAFYKQDGTYIKLISEDGLTKVGHAPFTDDDHARLSYILELAPSEFGNIDHPTELTDILSGATLKKFKHLVVKGAAYSTLRIHLYHQDSLKFIKKLNL